jgi:DNA-binding transcriptional ArsR family regulator
LPSESEPIAKGCSPDGAFCRGPEPGYLAEALANPLRSKILNSVAEVGLGSTDKTDDPPGITVRQLSELIQEPRRKVRYHLDALLEQRLIRVVRIAKRGGTVERYFGPAGRTILSRNDIGRLTPVQQQGVLAGCLRLIIASAAAALGAGVAVELPEWAAVRIPVQVDRRGWLELGELHEGLVREVDRVVAQASKRLAMSGDEPIDAVSANLLFLAPPWHLGSQLTPPSGSKGD